MDNEFQPSTKYRDIIVDWSRATRRVKKLAEELAQAEKEELKTAVEVGKSFVPPDAKIGEVFAVWVGDGLLSITSRNHEIWDFDVHWRTEPSPISATKIGL